MFPHGRSTSIPAASSAAKLHGWPLAAVQAAFAILLGRAAGYPLQANEPAATSGTASSVANNLRKALASRGIWTTQVSPWPAADPPLYVQVPVLDDAGQPVLNEDGTPAMQDGTKVRDDQPHLWALLVVDRSDFVDRNGVYVDVADAVVPDEVAAAIAAEVQDEVDVDPDDADVTEDEDVQD